MRTLKKNTVTTSLTLLTLSLAAFTLSCGQTDWGFEAIDSMVTPVDPPLTCGINIPADTLAIKRAGCGFGAGSHATDTLGISKETAAAIPIRHVIVLMKENRSFDHLFGKLNVRGQPGVETAPSTFSNLDAKGVKVTPFHADTTCIDADPGHQSESVMAAVAGGKMDGFVTNAAATTATDGHFVMSYYDESDLPFYYWLAKTYAINDRHFAPLQSGTFGSRDFMMFGTNAGVVDTGISFPDPSTNSIFRTLMNAGYTWGAYTSGFPFSQTLNWDSSYPGVHTIQELYDALDNGTLPNVAFVDALEDIEDDHPSADLQYGEAWVKRIYDHAVKSPQWGRLAIIWTYDEAGAFADHLQPPKGCVPNAGSLDWPYADFGPRIPLVAISPWAKRNFVSHVAHDHGAITRFIETLFDLPALTSRDANSDALLDMFDFSCGRDLTPPAGAPAPGTGRCANTPTAPVAEVKRAR